MELRKKTLEQSVARSSLSARADGFLKQVERLGDRFTPEDRAAVEACCTKAMAMTEGDFAAAQKSVEAECMPIMLRMAKTSTQ